MFCIKNNLPNNQWLIPQNKIKNQEQQKILSEYKIFINPQICGISKFHTYEIEECPSCPMYFFYYFHIFFRMSVIARRPKRIKAKYFTENFEEKEDIFEGFFARVFTHEVDHLDGGLFFDWEISQCEIKVKNPDEFYFLSEVFFIFKNKKTVDYYKERFMEHKAKFPNIFEETTIDNGEWLDLNEEKNKRIWDLGSAMEMDMLRSIRKDYREKMQKLHKLKPVSIHTVIE